MSPSFAFEKLGIALLLGLLVGLQREKAHSHIAGLRTFPLITCFGTLCGFLSRHYGVAPIAVGALGMIALLIVGNLPQVRGKSRATGITTEVAMLVMFGAGAYLVEGPAIISVVIGAGVAVLLQFKPELHGIVGRLGDADLRAIMRLVLLAFIVLPILPDEYYGPFQVLNPYEIWFLVVLIVSVNLIGYILNRLVGSQASVFLSGILGGLVSSTATAMSCAREVQEERVSSASAIILISTTVVYVRVGVEIAALSPALFSESVWSIGILFAVSVLLSFVYFRPAAKGEGLQLERPGDIRTALFFGVTYAAVAFALATAKHYFGTGSLYWVSGISGLTDVDAVSLSTARLVASNQLEAQSASRMIIIALLSNLFFKITMIALLQNWELIKRVGTAFAITTVVGIILLFIH